MGTISTVSMSVGHSAQDGYHIGKQSFYPVFPVSAEVKMCYSGFFFVVVFIGCCCFYRVFFCCCFYHFNNNYYVVYKLFSICYFLS